MAYCTVQQVRREIITERSTDNALIEDAIGQASDYIDRITETTFEVTEDSSRFFQIGKDTSGALLKINQPLCALTSVTNGNGDAIASSAYQVLPIDWQANGDLITGIRLTRSGLVKWRYTTYVEEDLIEVVGRWGYSTTVPPLIERAAIRLSTFFYKQRESGVLDTIAVPESGIIQTPIGFPREVKLMLRQFTQKEMMVL